MELSNLKMEGLVMKKPMWLVAVLILAFVAFSAADAQVRIPEKPKFEPKVQKQKEKRFLFQVEPAISFPSGTYKYEYGWWDGREEFEVDYDLSVAGANISFLPILINQVLSPDSSLMIEGRLRFTTGFWHFESEEWEEWNLIPLEGGLDVGVAYLLSRGYKIIPYAGFQYGIAFRNLEKGSTPENDLMYSLRFGLDLAMVSNMRVGSAFVINRVQLDEKEHYLKQEGTFKYNQIAFSISFGL
jgi:hypothetical protein